MPSVCFYFQVHQPFRIRRYRVFDVGHDSSYFEGEEGTIRDNKQVFVKVATKCYLPANKVLLENLRTHPKFRASFSFSGVVLRQMELYLPEVLRSFQELVRTGRVEILGETYYHSLAFLYSDAEFRMQVRMHSKKIQELFGVTPRVFRNTELMYNNAVAHTAEEMGFRGILAEGADHILGWRSPNFVYAPLGTKRIKLLLKNYHLSDDIAFRFSEKTWNEFPLTAPKFASWVNKHNGNGEVVNLFMDYETFGEHQWEDTGIFNFLRALPGEILQHKDSGFVTPSEAIERYEPRGVLDMPYVVSWADIERDLSAWRSNDMQAEALRRLYSFERFMYTTKDAGLVEDWRRLQTSDHFYYMCTKWFQDGDVHKYFSPYDSPYDAFISFTNVLHDLQLRVERHRQATTKKGRHINV